jgi:hypothetical protein
MTIKTQLNRTDYINATLAFRYSRTSAKIITAFGILLAGYMVYLTIIIPDQVDYSIFIMPAIIIVLPLVSSYLMATLNYKSNGRMSEPMEYVFSDDYLSIKGESFTTQFTWEKIYKVTQTNNWLFIWQNRIHANPIPKQSLTSDDIKELKTILDYHQVKNRL